MPVNKDECTQTIPVDNEEHSMHLDEFIGSSSRSESLFENESLDRLPEIVHTAIEDDIWLDSLESFLSDQSLHNECHDDIELNESAFSYEDSDLEDNNLERDISNNVLHFSLN